ncbi:hypothetical protein BJ742DRAFT_776203 [Cladochytrium replicatum]|nr:hypothetical protein BJ742DRAFT_776203 [Cladochytrium replicatum]
MASLSSLSLSSARNASRPSSASTLLSFSPSPTASPPPSGASDPEVQTVLISYALNLFICFGLLLLFSFVRRTNGRVYAPKLQFAPEKKRPPPLANLPTSWIRPSISTNELDLIEKIGPDAVMFLRFIRSLWRYFAIMSAFAIPLMVFHYFSPQITGSSAKFSVSNTTQAITNSSNTNTPPDVLASVGSAFQTSVSQLSLANVSAESPWIYLHVGLIYLFSFLAYLLLYFIWSDYAKVRAAWFSSDEFIRSIHNRMLLLTNVPDSIKSDEKIMRFMNSLGLSQPVKRAMVGRKVEQLPELILDHQTTTTVIERAFLRYFKDPSQVPSSRPHHRDGALLGLIGGKRVDSISFCGDKLHKLEDKIYDVRSKGEAVFEPDSSAFVLFDKIRDMHVAARKIAANKAGVPIKTGVVAPPAIKPCPSLDDLIWENIGLHPAVKISRRGVVYGIVTGLVIVWNIILVIVGAAVSLDSIENWFPQYKPWIESATWFQVLIKSVLAPVTLAILSAMLPKVLRWLARFQGVTTFSGVEKSTLLKLFFFQVYQVLFLVTLKSVADALITDLKTTAEQLASTGQVDFSKFGGDYFILKLNNAATGFVKNSSFYVALLATYLTSYGIEIVQGVPLLKWMAKRAFSRLTPREEDELNKPPMINYAPLYGTLLVLYLVTLCYCVIAPLIVPLAAILFLCAYVVMKYQVMYVYETKKETGGTWWPKVFDLVCISMMIAQVVTLGAVLLIIGQSRQTNSKVQAILVGVSPVLTLLFWFVCRRFIAPRSNYVSSDLDGKELGEYEDHSTADDEGGAYFSYLQYQQQVQRRQQRIGAGEDEAQSAEFESFLLNPALSRPLWKVWVKREARGILPQYYAPVYVDLDDYLVKTGKRYGQNDGERYRQGNRFGNAVKAVGGKVVQGAKAIGNVVPHSSAGKSGAPSYPPTQQQQRRPSQDGRRVAEPTQGYAQQQQQQQQQQRSYSGSEAGYVAQQQHRRPSQDARRVAEPQSSYYGSDPGYGSSQQARRPSVDEYRQDQQRGRSEAAGGYGDDRGRRSPSRPGTGGYGDDRGRRSPSRPPGGPGSGPGAYSGGGGYYSPPQQQYQAQSQFSSQEGYGRQPQQQQQRGGGY